MHFENYQKLKIAIEINMNFNIVLCGSFEFSGAQNSFDCTSQQLKSFYDIFITSFL